MLCVWYFARLATLFGLLYSGNLFWCLFLVWVLTICYLLDCDFGVCLCGFVVTGFGVLGLLFASFALRWCCLGVGFAVWIAGFGYFGFGCFWVFGGGLLCLRVRGWFWFACGGFYVFVCVCFVFCV